MRKIFRMQYESCSGQCYAYSDVMRIHTLGLDVRGATEFLKRLVSIHAPSCGNPNIQFRLDIDEDLGVFVASLYRYGALDLFGDKTALGAMNKLIDGALKWYDSEEGQKLLAKDGVRDRDRVCHHGTDSKLVEFALRFSGLDSEEERAVRREMRL